MKMVEAVQPHCDEEIVAAMTCSHSGAMGAVFASKLFGGAGAGGSQSKLPNPVFIAVGSNSIYAFDYAPKGFKFKIKKLAARWAKGDVTVQAENTGAMANFSIATTSGESYALEIPTMMGGKGLVDMFFSALMA